VFDSLVKAFSYAICAHIAFIFKAMFELLYYTVVICSAHHQHYHLLFLYIFFHDSSVKVPVS